MQFVGHVETQAGSIDRRLVFLQQYLYNGRIAGRDPAGARGLLPTGVYPAADGKISHAKPTQDERTTLDCATGIGSFVGVTACFGFTAVAHAIGKYLKTQSD